MFQGRSTSCLDSYVLLVPSSEEIAFAIEILDTVLSPAMDKVDALIESAPRWDSIERNDFCRYGKLCVFCTDANPNWEGTSMHAKLFGTAYPHSLKKAKKRSQILAYTMKSNQWSFP